MPTITIWLLIAIGAGPANVSGPSTTNVIERFASQKDCDEVRKALIIYEPKSALNPNLRCIAATVLERAR